MPQGNYLLKLVSGLNKSEVSLVETELLADSTKRSCEVLQLFRIYHNLPDQTKVFSNNKLVEVLRERKVEDAFVKHIHYWKKILYDKILVCLRELYERGDNLAVRIGRHRSNGAILWRKGMQAQAIAELNKALKLAEGYDWLVYLRVSLDIRTFYMYGVGKMEYQSVDRELLVVLDKIKDEISLYSIYEEVFLVSRNRVANRGEVIQNIPKKIAALFEKENVSELPVIGRNEIEKLSKDLSLESSAALCSVMAAYHGAVLRDYDSALVYLELLLSIKKDKKHAYLDQNAYLNLLNNILNNQFFAGRYKDMDIIIEKLSKVNPDNPGMEAKKLHHLHYYKMMSLLAIKNYNGVTLLGKVIENSWNKYEQSLTHSRKLTFYYNLSVAFLIENNLKEARKWNEKNIEDKNFRIRPDIRFLARIVELLICFDKDILTRGQDEGFRIKYYANGLLRSLQNSKQDYPVKIKIVKTIREASLKNELCEIAASFLELKRFLLENKQAHSSEFSEFVDWIDRRFGNHLQEPLMMEKSP